MKFLFLILSILLNVNFIDAQSITGQWQGELSLQASMKLPLVFHFEQKNDSIKGTMDSPAQGAKNIPIDQVTFIKNELLIEIKSLSLTYTGTTFGDSIKGTFTQANQNFPLTLKRSDTSKAFYNRPQEPRPPFNYNIAEVSFVNKAQQNILAGTLSTPKNKKQFPVVVLITGSGAQNRDEEMFGHKPFWVIADHFANNGIGVLRIDDRGVGGSSKGKTDDNTADFATDINAAVGFLRSSGFTNIGLVGHSEGAMIAPMVAGANKDVKFIILMAGPGIPIDQLMLLQANAVGKSTGSTEDILEKNQTDFSNTYHFIKNYKGSQYKNDLTKMVAASVAKNSMYTPEEQDNIVRQRVATFSNPWFHYFIKFDPQVYLQKITIPVLALNGSLDTQVTPTENLAGIKKSLTQAGNKNFETIAVPGLNHLFQQAQTGSPAEYATIEQTISPAVLDIMTQWILKINKGK